MLTLLRYLLRDVTKPALVALGTLLALVWVLQGVRYLDFVINKGLGVGTFLELTGYLVPMLLVVVLPLAVVVGVGWGLRRLHDDNELLVLLATGMGKWKLATPALLLAVAAVAVGYVNALVWLPASTTKFKDLQHNLRTMQGQILLEEGTFNQLGDLMVYLQKRVGPTVLAGLLVHDARVGQPPVTWLAQKGSIELGSDGNPRLVLERGIRQEVGERNVSMLEFERHVMDIRQRLGAGVLAPRMRDRAEYGWRELLAEARENERERGKLVGEASKRLVWPLAPLPLVLVACGLLLQRPRRHGGSLRKMLALGAVVVGYFSALLVLQSVVEKGAADGWLTVLWLPLGLPVLVGCWGIWRLSQHD